MLRRSIMDLFADLRNTFPNVGNGRKLTQAKQVTEGDECRHQSYLTYKAMTTYKEDCQITHLANDVTQSDCSYTQARRITSLSQEGTQANELRRGEYGDHYMKYTGQGVQRRKGARFPMAGKKMVVIRNWQGAITFNEGNPSYSFSNGSETVSGTYDTRDNK